MTEIHIDLPWWSPSPDEPIGADRAAEVVRRLQEVADPVVQEAEAGLEQLIVPGAPIVWSMDHRGYIARLIFSPEVESQCVGVVYEDHGDYAAQNAIELSRDGVLR